MPDFLQSTQEFLQGGHLTPQAIRGTTDFSTLFNLPENRQILEQVGYGPQLQKLRPFQFPTQYPSLTSSEQQHLEATAETLTELMRQRGVESRSRSFFAKPPERPEKAFGYMNVEAVPYSDSGHLPSAAGAPFSQRKARTGRLMGAFSNEQGRNVFAEDLGLDPLENRNITGLYTSPSGITETNPGWTVGMELPLTWDRNKPNLPLRTQRKVDLLSGLHGYLLNQGGVPTNVPVPLAKGPDMVVPLEKKVGQGALAALTGRVPLIGNLMRPDTFMADTGSGAIMSSFKGRPLATTERETYSTVLGNPPGVPVKNLSRYYSQEEALDQAQFRPGAGPGSGAATRQLLETADRVSGADYAAVDKRIRGVADRVLREEQSWAAQYPNDPTRQDYFSALEYLRTKGLEGLREALKAGVVLPAGVVAALVAEDTQK